MSGALAWVFAGREDSDAPIYICAQLVTGLAGLAANDEHWGAE